MFGELVVQVVGVVGGLLGVINTLQIWRQNRPRVSFDCDRDGTERKFNVLIYNPSDRDIIISDMSCIGDHCKLDPFDYSRKVDGQETPPWRIGPRSTEIFTLMPLPKNRCCYLSIGSVPLHLSYLLSRCLFISLGRISSFCLMLNQGLNENRRP